VSRGPIQLGAGESLAAALLFFGLAVLTAVLGSGCGAEVRIEQSHSRDVVMLAAGVDADATGVPHEKGIAGGGVFVSIDQPTS
jgi:hypothetical protein